MALDQSGFGEQLEMARDARLRLAQDLGQVGDGQFGLGQQREDAQPRGLRGRPQSGVDEFEWQPVDHLPLHAWTVLGASVIRKHIRICLYGNLVGASPIWRRFSSHGIRIAALGLSPNVAHARKPEQRGRYRRPPRRDHGRPCPTTPMPASISSAASARPGREREDCPKNARESDAVCTIEVDPRWAAALDGVETCTHLVVLYWMDKSRRDIAVQVPRHYGKGRGTFALRSPARPNPIAMSVVALKGSTRTFACWSPASIASTARR